MHLENKNVFNKTFLGIFFFLERPTVTMNTVTASQLERLDEKRDHHVFIRYPIRGNKVVTTQEKYKIHALC